MSNTTSLTSEPSLVDIVTYRFRQTLVYVRPELLYDVRLLLMFTLTRC